MVNENNTKAKEDARNSLCSYLHKNKTACRQIDSKKVSIENVSKDDGELYCPECKSDVGFRKGIEREHHFYHMARISKMEFAAKNKESLLHQKCKDALCTALSAKFPNGQWAKERVGKCGNVKADISGKIGNQWLVIEVQKSQMSPKKIIERTQRYSDKLKNPALKEHPIPVLWVIPLKEPLGDEPFRPRLMERLFHALYGGKCFYWDETNPDKIYPVHYATATRHIRYGGFYNDEDKEYKEEYYKDEPYKTIKNPQYSKNKYIDIADAFMPRWSDDLVFLDPVSENSKQKDTKMSQLYIYDYNYNENLGAYLKDELVMKACDYQMMIDKSRFNQMLEWTIESGKKYKGYKIKTILKDKSYVDYLKKEQFSFYSKVFSKKDIKDILEAAKLEKKIKSYDKS